MATSDITAQLVRDLLDYNPETGVLSWRKPRSGVNVNAPVGTKHPHGYISLRVMSKKLLAHRIAWLHYYGNWPDGEIDHINGIKTDNRISNLRDVDRTANMQNVSRAFSTSLTGLQGVQIVRKYSPTRYTARITRGGRYAYLGFFKTAEEAHAAYLDAKQSIQDRPELFDVYAKRRGKKLTNEQVLEVLERLKQKETHEAVAAAFGVSRSYVTAIGLGRRRVASVQPATGVRAA